MLRASKLYILLSFVLLSVVVLACSETDPDAVSRDQLLDPTIGEIRYEPRKPIPNGGAAGTADFMLEVLQQINISLENADSPYRAGMVEWITSADSDEAGNEVFFNNRGNKQLGFDFVANDARRIGPGAGDEITYLVDFSDGATASGLGAVATETAIDAAMATWGSLGCLTTIVKVADPGADPDLIDGFFGLPGGGIGTPFAQVTHAGWMNGFPVGVLGVTFTFGFTDANGFTDIDNNGLADAAFREIYYHDIYNWNIDGSVDVETVALHEAGHGLSQAHFGKLFRTPSNGQFHFAPRAVMNAGYTGVQQVPTGTDEAGHCSLWDSWPNN